MGKMKALVAGVFFVGVVAGFFAYERDDFLRLIYNTDECFVDCYAILEVSNPSAKPILLDEDNWRTWFVRGEGGELVDGLRVEVLDTGIGIRKVDQKKVFELFVRVGKSQEIGTGLGLSVVSSIVEAHGGAVGVESKKGSGSMFWFEIPVK